MVSEIAKPEKTFGILNADEIGKCLCKEMYVASNMIPLTEHNGRFATYQPMACNADSAGGCRRALNRQTNKHHSSVVYERTIQQIRVHIV